MARTIDKSHPRPPVWSTHHSDFGSAVLKSADRMESQLVARVGGNGERGIHEIIGKEVIGGEIYYCMGWDPTMMSECELGKAQRLMRKFGAKGRARLRRAENTRKERH
jgi:hypothetical protein